MTDTLTVWTIGHSNRSLEAFVELLQLHGIEAIADVRRFPVRGGCHSSAARRCGVHWVKRVSAMPGSRSLVVADGRLRIRPTWPGATALSRLRRSFAERRIQPRAQPFAGNGGPATHRDDVRRGALVALPPFTGIGCAEDPRYRGAASRTNRPPPTLSLPGTAGRRPAELCRRQGRAAEEGSWQPDRPGSLAHDAHQGRSMRSGWMTMRPCL